MAYPMPNPLQIFRDANGDPLPLGKVYTYAAGTSTPLATFTDETENAEHTNPIILDANGSAEIWLSTSSYKFIIKDSNNNLIDTIDTITHIANNEITTTKIVNSAVTTAKIADNAVTSAKIENTSISTAKIADLAVTTAKIANDAVTVDKLADSAVVTANIVNANVTFAKLDTDFIADAVLQDWSPADLILFADVDDLPNSGAAPNITKKMALSNLLDLQDKRRMQYIKNAGAATATNLGFLAAPTLTATAASNDETGSFGGAPFLKHTTAASNGAASGVISSTFTELNVAWLPEFSCRVRSSAWGSANGQDCRYFIGFFSASPDALGALADTSTSPSVKMAAFVAESPSSGGASNFRWAWVAHTADGSGTAGHTTKTACSVSTYSNPPNGVNVDPSPRDGHLLTIKFVTTSEVRFYIDGYLVAVHTTNLPSTTSSLGFGIRVVSTAASAHSVDWSFIQVRHK